MNSTLSMDKWKTPAENRKVRSGGKLPKIFKGLHRAPPYPPNQRKKHLGLLTFCHLSPRRALYHCDEPFVTTMSILALRQGFVATTGTLSLRRAPRTLLQLCRWTLSMNSVEELCRITLSMNSADELYSVDGQMEDTCRKSKS